MLLGGNNLKSGGGGKEGAGRGITQKKSHYLPVKLG